MARPITNKILRVVQYIFNITFNNGISIDKLYNFFFHFRLNIDDKTIYYF